MRIPNFVVLLSLAIPAALAQAPASNQMSADLKSTWSQIKGYTLRAAEKMPEENYDFKPSPDVRSFGAMVAHIADGNTMICSAAKGEKKEANAEKTKTTKADLVAALKESIAYCDTIVDSATDASLTEVIKFFGRDRARISALTFNIAHDYEHYGNLVTYMRIKGIVPPSSEPRPAAAKPPAAAPSK